MIKPDVLVLTGAVPYPLVTGAKIRTFNLLKSLADEFNIELLTIITDKKEKKYLQALESAGITCHYLFKPDLHRRPARGIDAILSLILPAPYLIRHYTIKDYRKHLSDLVREKQYRVLHCDSISMTGNFAGMDTKRLILTQHNIEHEIWAGYADHARNMAMKLFYRNQHRKVRRLEAGLDDTYEYIVTVSDEDKKSLANDFPEDRIVVVENGVDPEVYRTDMKPDNRAGIVFTGSLDWHPNIDGLIWFFNEVYPILRDKTANINISIVGRKPSTAIRELVSDKPGVRLRADVPEIQPFLHRARLMMVPLRIGGGSRLKILEAMASGLPVVSTAKGAEGLAVADGENIIIRDDPNQFADGLIQLLNDDSRHRKISASGMELIQNRYAWNKVSRALADLWRKVADV